MNSFKKWPLLAIAISAFAPTRQDPHTLSFGISSPTLSFISLKWISFLPLLQLPYQWLPITFQSVTIMPLPDIIFAEVWPWWELQSGSHLSQQPRPSTIPVLLSACALCSLPPLTSLLLFPQLHTSYTFLPCAGGPIQNHSLGPGAKRFQGLH